MTHLLSSESFATRHKYSRFESWKDDDHIASINTALKPEGHLKVFITISL